MSDARDGRPGFWTEHGQLVRAVGRTMGVTLRNLVRKPVTVHYPDVKRAYPDRFRGLLAFTYDPETGEENCIGCRLCEYICPPQVIKVEMLKAEKRNFAKSFALELYACEFCEMCVQVCPDRRDHHDEVVRPGHGGPARAPARQGSPARAWVSQFEPSWATGNRLRDMQAPPKPAKAEAKPATAKTESTE